MFWGWKGLKTKGLNMFCNHKSKGFAQHFVAITVCGDNYVISIISELNREFPVISDWVVILAASRRRMWPLLRKENVLITDFSVVQLSKLYLNNYSLKTIFDDIHFIFSEQLWTIMLLSSSCSALLLLKLLSYQTVSLTTNVLQTLQFIWCFLKVGDIEVISTNLIV